MFDAVKQISSLGSFGLVVFMILAAVKFGPKVVDLWTRGVVAMEKIADDMTVHQEEVRETHAAITSHDMESSIHVAAIRGDIAGVKQDVLRVEDKVDRIAR